MHLLARVNSLSVPTFKAIKPLSDSDSIEISKRGDIYIETNLYIKKPYISLTSTYLTSTYIEKYMGID